MNHPENLHGRAVELFHPADESQPSRRGFFRSAGFLAAAGGVVALGFGSTVAAPATAIPSKGSSSDDDTLYLFASVSRKDLQGEDSASIPAKVIASTFTRRVNALEDKGKLVYRVSKATASDVLLPGAESPTGGPQTVELDVTTVDSASGEKSSARWYARYISTEATGYGVMYTSDSADAEGSLNGISEVGRTATAGPDLWDLAEYPSTVPAKKAAKLANRILDRKSIGVRVASLDGDVDYPGIHATLGTTEGAYEVAVKGVNLLGDGPGLFIQWYE